MVTFIALPYPGDQHYRPISKLGLGYSHKLSVDGSFLRECSDLELSLCSNSGFTTAYVGSTQETQQIVTGTSPFTITVGDYTSPLISVTESIRDLEEKLSGLGNIGDVAVGCMSCTNNAISAGETIFISFLSHRGDLHRVSVSDPNAIVTEVISGASQP
eukprot:2581260-Ditylum_brightwellii.AAC.1